MKSIKANIEETVKEESNTAEFLTNKTTFKDKIY